MSMAALSPESLRIQLEGALEVLEEGERRYASLVRQLSGSRWRGQRSQQPGLLAQVRAHESALAEAVARVERRARQEQWPEAHPVLGLLRALRERRARVESLARERLANLSAWKDGSLGEVLAELEARIVEPGAPPPTEGVLLEVDTRGAFPAAFFLATLLGIGVILFLYPYLSGLGLALAGGVLVGALAFWQSRNQGRFWLTRERMVWRTRSGHGVQVPLSTLSASDVELLPVGTKPWGVGLRMGGTRPLVIPRLRLATAEWLTLLRALPQPEAHAFPGEECVLLPVVELVSGDLGHRWPVGQRGLLVFLPGTVAFLPSRYAESVGGWTELLTRVGRLSPKALERFVWMAVRREGGKLLRPEEVDASPAIMDGGPAYRFILRGQRELMGATTAFQQAVLARLLERWREQLHRP
jgi:hypothetical protein